MKRHERCFSDAKGKKRKKNPGCQWRYLSCEDAAGLKRHAPGEIPGGNDRRQQKRHRCTDQNPKIDAPAPTGLGSPSVGHKRVGG